MRVCSWNCRCLGGPSTISQLKEELRFYLSDLVFLCETKKKKAFVQTVFKKLKGIVGYKIVDPKGLSGGLALGWSANISVKQVVKTDFCVEVEIEVAGRLATCWGIFVYANVDRQIRKRSMGVLDATKAEVGRFMVFREIKEKIEKRGGRLRSKASFRMFKDFIKGMRMAEIKYIGKGWTWANNREGEGFVEEKIDRFFWPSPEWTLQYPNAKVHHIQKQTSDHSLLLLEDKPHDVPIVKRFYFDRKMLEVSDFAKTVTEAWTSHQEGFLMFQVSEKIKNYRMILLKLRRQHNCRMVLPIRSSRRSKGKWI